MDSKQKAYTFALKIIELIDSLSHEMSTQVMAKQLLRAATSIGANIIEAQASPSRRDFTNFFNYSLKSANETKYWLGLLKDSHNVDGKIIDVLMQEANEIANILGASIITLKNGKKL